MKAIFNWRYYVIYALFSIGIISLLFIFSEDDRPLGAWIEMRIYLAIISAASFYIMHRLRTCWTAKGELPEFSHQTEEYGNKD